MAPNTHFFWISTLVLQLTMQSLQSASTDFEQHNTTAQSRAGIAMARSLKNAIDSGANSFQIPPGDYRLASSLDLYGLDGFTLEGQGATLIFTTGRGGIRLRNCTNCVVKEFTLDLDPLPFTQGTVVAVDPVEKTLDYLLDAGYPLFGPREAKRDLRCVFFDPSGSEELGIIDTCVSLPAEIAPGVYRSSAPRVFDAEARKLAKGDRIAIALGYPPGGVHVIDSAGIRVQDVTIFAAGGMAFTESGFAPGGHIYERCRVVRRPGSRRLMAGASDGFHSMTQRKGPILKNCEISHCFDDLVNIHGFISFALERRDNGAWIIAGPAGQDFSPGSLLRFYRSPNAEPVGEARILSCQPYMAMEPAQVGRKVEAYFTSNYNGLRIRSFFKPQPCEVRLEQDVPLSPYDFVSCPDYGGSDAVIEDCYFHDGHVRGILLKSSGSTVTRCRFERIARSGIVIAPEIYWLEGPFPHDVRIAGNTLTDCGFGAVSKTEKHWEFAPIMVLSATSDRLFPPRFSGAVNMRRLEFTDNSVIRAPGPGILVMNTEDVKLNGNSIVFPGAKSEARHTLDLTKNLPLAAKPSEAESDAMRAPSYGIFLMSVRGARGEGNRVEGGRGIIGRGWAVESTNVQ